MLENNRQENIENIIWGIYDKLWTSKEILDLIWNYATRVISLTRVVDKDCYSKWEKVLTWVLNLEITLEQLKNLKEKEDSVLDSLIMKYMKTKDESLKQEIKEQYLKITI